MVERRDLKRKRNDEGDVSAKITSKLYHELKEVKKAAKKAKTFELQKLVKKIKAARNGINEEREATELEKELEMLKRTDHETIAQSALRSKFRKDAILSQHLSSMDELSVEPTAQLDSPNGSGSASVRVRSRLMSSKILAAQVSVALERLKCVADPERKKDIILVEDVGRAAQSRRAPNGEVENEDALGISNSDGEDESAGSGEEDSHLNGEVWDSDPNDDDGSDSDPASLSDGMPNDEVVRPTRTTSKNLKTPVAASTQTRPKSSVSQSTFLPSLAVGFTRGDDDASDWSDSEAKIADSDQKKNRRGQRARRAIWEKKFGRNANHKKKEKEAEELKARAPRKRRDLTTSSGQRQLSGGRQPSGAQRNSKAPLQQKQQPDSGWPSSTYNKTLPTTPAEKSSERRIHPSWEAKRKMKEKQSAGIVPAQGKKIKFS